MIPDRWWWKSFLYSFPLSLPILFPPFLLCSFTIYCLFQPIIVHLFLSYQHALEHDEIWPILTVPITSSNLHRKPVNLTVSIHVLWNKNVTEYSCHEFESFILAWWVLWAKYVSSQPKLRDTVTHFYCIHVCKRRIFELQVQCILH
jgi:hypothetical protein